MEERGHGILGLKGTAVVIEGSTPSSRQSMDRNSHKMNPIDVNDFLGLIVVITYRP